MHDHQIQDVCLLLKSVAHPFRLQILCLLQDGELSVGALREQVQTTNANITQHLNVLRQQGLITFRKEANFIYNRICDERINQLIATLKRLYCQPDSEP